MFGYVVVDKPNILIKDYETYRSYYCGLCKAIGEGYGNLLRLTLNYDIVLLALLGHNAENLDPIFANERCVNHPVRKIPVVKNNRVMSRVADINIVLGYYKACDDVADEGRHRGFKAALTPAFKKAAKRIPDFAKAVEKGYEKLREGEKKKYTADRLADIFGTIMTASGDALSEKTSSDIKKILYYAGRWVYLADATDDVKTDCEKGRFNPFRTGAWEENAFADVEKVARPMLYDCIARMTEVYDRIKINIGEGPLSNIIFRGFKSKTEQILSAKGQKRKSPKV